MNFGISVKNSYILGSARLTGLKEFKALNSNINVKFYKRKIATLSESSFSTSFFTLLNMKGLRIMCSLDNWSAKEMSCVLRKKKKKSNLFLYFSLVFIFFQCNTEQNNHFYKIKNFQINPRLTLSTLDYWLYEV